MAMRTALATITPTGKLQLALFLLNRPVRPRAEKARG